MHWSKGGLYWKLMLKPSSNLWVNPEFYELIELPSYLCLELWIFLLFLHENKSNNIKTLLYQSGKQLTNMVLKCKHQLDKLFTNMA